MPKNTFTPKEPIEKLTLAARKDIRDNYEVGQEEFEGRVASALKLDKFSFKFNANELWVYNKDVNMRPGFILAGYAEGVAAAIESFVRSYGDDGIQEFNAVVTKSEATVNVDELGDDAPTISARIKDGVFQVLFHHEKLGYNATWVPIEYIVSSIDSFPRKGLTLEAKRSVAKEWEPERESLTQSIAEILKIPDLVLEPNFEENFAKLLPEKKDDSNFSRSFGSATFAYFDGLKTKLEYDRVKDDDMVREAIQESLGKKVIQLRIVEKLKSGSYNGIAFEDGTFYLETTPANWYVNTGDIGNTLLDVL